MKHLYLVLLGAVASAASVSFPVSSAAALPQSAIRSSAPAALATTPTPSASASASAAVSGPKPADVMIDEPQVTYSFYEVKQIGDISDDDFLSRIKNVMYLKDNKHMPDDFWDTVFDEVAKVVEEKHGLMPERVYQLYLLAGTRMMEMFMNAANSSLDDDEMKGKWQTKYQDYVQDYYGTRLEAMCFKNPSWFDCTTPGSRSKIQCPTDMNDDMSANFTLKSDQGAQKSFNDYLNSTLGLTRDVIKMDAKHQPKYIVMSNERALATGNQGLALANANPGQLHKRVPPPGTLGGPMRYSREFIVPGLKDDYPPKMGIVLTNFTNSARESLSSMKSMLSSHSTDVNALYNSVIQVIVRTQSGNDVLDQYYQYKEWVDKAMEMEKFVKGMVLEVVLGILLGGLVDGIVGVVGEAITAVAEAITAAKNVASTIKTVASAFDAAKQLPVIGKAIKYTEEGIKVGKQIFTKVWDVLPKRVQELFVKLRPKIGKVKDYLKKMACDKVSEFADFSPADSDSDSTTKSTRSLPVAPSERSFSNKRSVPSQSQSGSAAVSKDDCIFGIQSTSQISGYNSPDDQVLCYCHQTSSTVVTQLNGTVTCPDGKVLQRQYLKPNPPFDLGGFEKTYPTTTCDHVWPLSELLAFTAVQDSSRAKEMCQRISQVMPGFNSMVRRLINGPDNSQVLTYKVASLKHQVFTGNIDQSFFQDTNTLTALKKYMDAKNKTFSSMKAMLGSYFIVLESAESKAEVKDRYFTGVTSKFLAFFDGGVARRAALMAQLEGASSASAAKERAQQLDGIASWLDAGVSNFTTYAGDYINRSTKKAVNKICRKALK
ncbi:hypothetical protein GQ54DRAFT_338682 [Martensiomyces pterosporus]|nr:hypothetical protein GQ54DRAFT_338682 [Martensiomyces pterosporus]